jgi:hypothetical protein
MVASGFGFFLVDAVEGLFLEDAVGFLEDAVGFLEDDMDVEVMVVFLLDMEQSTLFGFEALALPAAPTEGSRIAAGGFRVVLRVL